MQLNKRQARILANITKKEQSSKMQLEEVECKVISTPPTPPKVSYQVVHQNAKRIRLLVLRLADDTAYAEKLKSLVHSLDCVTSVYINSAARSMAVEYDFNSSAEAIALSQQKLFEIIEQTVYVEIESLEATEAETSSQNQHEINYWERLGLPALALTLSLGAVAGLPFPGVLTGAAIFVAALPVFQRALECIQQERQLNIDFLDGLAISLHTINGNYFAPSFMLGLIEGGEVIRDMTARGSERASLDLLDCLGKYALVERDGAEVQIPVKEIVTGDHVIVYPGDQIPVDGYVLRGTGLIDQCKLTGESVPVTRTEGEEVFASTLLVDGHLCILVERTGNNTRAGVIVSLMQAAPVHDTRVENYAAAVANQMVVPTLLLGAGVGIINADLNRAVALLTLDLGTGIRVSVPTTILSALTYAARNGVFVRSGRAIEILARIDTVVFDKTGTLTQGHAGVTGIKLTDAGVEEQEVLALAASAEQGLTHPVAEAIIRHAWDKGVSLYKCQEWEYRVGLGVIATINDIELLVGSHRLMAQANISLDYLNQHYPDIKSGSNSLVYVARDGKLLGVILYSDPLRAESQGVIQELEQVGISSYMLSGDVTRVAKAIANELDIKPDNIYAEAFPERKVEVVKSLHDTGKTVAFCGDGINDSAALAYADVSISFAGATDIARETADVVLMEDDLRGLVHAIKIAKQAMEIIWQNTAIVAVPNVGALIAGVLFALDPILAIVINNGSAILAELNGLRPLLGTGGVTPLVSHSLDAVELPEEDNRLHSHEDEPARKIEVDAETKEELVIPMVDTATETKQVLHEHQLTQQELAKRLGLNSKTLSRQRSKPDFTNWSKAKDPEGIGWAYNPASRIFHKVEEQSNELKSFNSEPKARNGKVAEDLILETLQ
jgi:Cu2+-exporting ATPase